MNSTKHNKVAIVLFILYILLFVILAINPYARNVWFAENMTILPIVVVLLIFYIKGIRFSSLSYILMAFLVFMHTIGGHYSFARVPFENVTDFFGWERNNYDRIAHAAVGLYAFPIAEYLSWKNLIKNKWIAVLFGLFTVMAIAAAYEIFEWQYAVLGDPLAGIEVLGSQGDIWDAQKDMLCDTIGGIIGSILFLFWSWKKSIK